MLKRVFWLMAAVCLPVVGLLLLAATVLRAAGTAEEYPVIINEWSQGESGSREWVELLVVTPTADLRSWDVGDSSAGDLAFADDPLWAAVSAGTLIVIYNGNDKDSIIPADDDAADDYVLILPHDHPTLFEGSWPLFANSTETDNPHLRDQNDVTVHHFSAAPGTSLHAGAGEAVQYRGDTATGVTAPAGWTAVPAAQGTPGQGNGSDNDQWIAALRGSSAETADLSVEKDGQATAQVGSALSYTITVRNKGTIAATAVVVTDQLPAGMSYLTDNSGYTANIAGSEVVWEVGELAPEATVSFQLTTAVGYEQLGWLTNTVSVQTVVTESVTVNNQATAATYIQPAGTAVVLLEAVLYQGQAKGNGQGDEAVAVRNFSTVAADLSGWTLSDGTSAAAQLPEGAILPAGETIWLAADAEAFRQQFGFWPVYAIAPAGETLGLGGSWPGFADGGDEVLLFDQSTELVDAVVYEEGDTAQMGWSGAAVEPYKIHSGTAVRGQILYRKRDGSTGVPVADSDTAADWAQDMADPVHGRKVRYPGWLLEDYFWPMQITNTANITLAVAPDNGYQTLVEAIGRAEQTIEIELHTFEHVGLAEALSAAAERGVSVTVLLEGGPPGGIDDQQRYVCQQLEQAGGQCWYMVNDSTADIYDRYTYLHAKFGVIDGRIGFISSENFSPNSLPDDDKSDGTWGRRGLILLTDAPDVVAYLQTLFAADFDPAQYRDLLRYDEADPVYGGPPSEFVPQTETGGITYTVRYPSPAVFAGTFSFEFVQSPENSLSVAGGMLPWLNRAGEGDTVLVQQLSERPHWGDNPESDPNLRLMAYLEAARRGARVRLLLDSYFNTPSDPVSNSATCLWLNEVARVEGLDLRCVVGNPAGLGIHNKMIAAQIDGQGIVHIGSLNGTEQSHKGNRELAVQVASDELYLFVADLFTRDWPHRALLPFIGQGVQGAASYVLISEVLYDPSGSDGSEFIELVNPTGWSIDLSGYTLGDAITKEEFADVRQFPEGTQLASQQVLVVAQQAAAFEEKFGLKPDFEILETDPAVPNLIDDLNWGDTATFLQLGNSGDVVILRDPAEWVVDALAYGEVAYLAHLTCGAVETNHSLRRNPYRVDTDQCSVDFEDWPIPDPGRLPNS